MANNGRPRKACITCGGIKEEGIPKGGRLCLTCSALCNVCQERPRVKQHRGCAQCIAKADRARRSTPVAKFAQRITRIASKYKVRRPYAAILAAKPSCDACGGRANGTKGLHVDHCHTTGRVRGVLCFGCNAALGHLGDSIERLQRLIAYLETASATHGVADLEKAKHYLEMLIELEGRK